MTAAPTAVLQPRTPPPPFDLNRSRLRDGAPPCSWWTRGILTSCHVVVSSAPSRQWPSRVRGTLRASPRISSDVSKSSSYIEKCIACTTRRMGKSEPQVTPTTQVQRSSCNLADTMFVRKDTLEQYLGCEAWRLRIAAELLGECYPRTVKRLRVCIIISVTCTRFNRT